MAHELEKSEDFVYTGMPAWHGLGEHYPNGLLIDDLYANTNLNFKVELSKVFDDEGNEVEGWRTIRRTDNKRHLSRGTVSEKYVPLQNEDAFRFFRPFEEQGLVKLETAGVLRGGEKIWVLAELLNSAFAPLQGDEYRSYLLLVNGFDRRTALQVMDTAVRVVCSNTMMAALSQGGEKAVRIHHRRGIHQALDMVQEITLKSRERFMELNDVLKLLADKPVSIPSLKNYYRRVYGLPFMDMDQVIQSNRKTGVVKTEKQLQQLEDKLRSTEQTIDRMMKAYYQEEESIHPSARGTYYHGIQGLTRFLTWYRNPKNPESQFETNNLGTAEAIRQDAIKYALAA